jgi:hypothetical protein
MWFEDMKIKYNTLVQYDDVDGEDTKLKFMTCDFWA